MKDGREGGEEEKDKGVENTGLIERILISG